MAATLICTVGLLFWAQAATYALKNDLGVAPDERAHLAYIKNAATDHWPLPDYENGRVGGRLNYLGHPPLYYSLVGTALRITDSSPDEAYIAVRMLSVSMVTLGLMLTLLAAWLMGAPTITVLAAGVATSSVPIIPYLAGSINNDNLAYLGAALSLLGLSRLKTGGPWHYLTFTGAAIVALTKVNVAAFVLVILAVQIPRAALKDRAILKDRHLWFAVTGCGALCFLYYFWAWSTFGEPLPRPSPLYSSRPVVNPLSPLAYTQKFFSTIVDRLPTVGSHRSFKLFAPEQRTYFRAMILLPFMATALARLISPPSFTRDYVDAFLAATAFVLMVHMTFTYNLYLDSSRLGGMQPRYYTYLLPMLFLLPVIASPFSARLNTAYGILLMGLAVWSQWTVITSPVDRGWATRAEHQPYATTRVLAMTLESSARAPLVPYPNP